MDMSTISYLDPCLQVISSTNYRMALLGYILAQHFASLLPCPPAARKKIVRFAELSGNRGLIRSHQSSAASRMFDLCFVGPHTMHSSRRGFTKEQAMKEVHKEVVIIASPHLLFIY
ncbi:hypothetical protein ACEPAG_7533 [Sanghuangporus baumii]